MMVQYNIMLHKTQLDQADYMLVWNLTLLVMMQVIWHILHDVLCHALKKNAKNYSNFEI